MSIVGSGPRQYNEERGSHSTNISNTKSCCIFAISMQNSLASVAGMHYILRVFEQISKEGGVNFTLRGKRKDNAKASSFFKSI